MLYFVALLSSLIVWATQAVALSPLFDGDFESDTLQGWNPGTSGTAIVVSRGTCFAGNDTTTLSIRGRYAGMLRSVTDIENKQAASLTSKPFIAGRGLVFLAISELLGDTPKQNPFALNVSILDAAGKVLQTEAIATALADLTGGCPSATGDASFGQHFINTHAYAGKQIKLRFSHHPDLAKEGAFTLVDEVSIVSVNETPIFQSFPIAKAGFRFEEKHLFLIAGLPDGDIKQTQDWQFSWLINGETTRRPYFNPCIDDLEPGDYTANLYVRQNERLITDTLHFSVPYIIFSRTAIGSDTATSTPITTGSGKNNETPTDLICDVRHPTDLASDSTLLNEDNEDEDDDDDGDDGDDGNGNDEGEDEGDGITPALSGLILGSPFVANRTSVLVANINIESDINISSASITLTPADTGDELIPPKSSELNGLSVSCSNDTTCTLSGSAASDTYKTAIQGLDATFSASQGSRTLTISVVDIDDLTSDSISESFNVNSLATP